MMGTVFGSELKEIWTRWGTNDELISVPPIRLSEIIDKAEYRVHIPMDLYIKLGQRKKNLRNPKPGLTFSTEELIPYVFGNSE